MMVRVDRVIRQLDSYLAGINQEGAKELLSNSAGRESCVMKAEAILKRKKAGTERQELLLE
jgi:hypothetical protein